MPAPRAKKDNLIKRRPAESVTFAAGAAVLVGYLAGIDEPGVLAACAAVVGGLPAFVTSIVDAVRG